MSNLPKNVGKLRTYASQLRRVAFDFKGRINRSQFGMGLLLSFIIAWMGPDTKDSSTIYLFFFAVFQLIVLSAIYTKRLHDINFSAVLFLIVGVVLNFSSYFLAPILIFQGFMGNQVASISGQVITYATPLFWILSAIILLIKAGDDETNNFGNKPGSGFTELLTSAANFETKNE